MTETHHLPFGLRRSEGNAMEWVKGIEDLDIRIFRAQGIVSVGAPSAYPLRRPGGGLAPDHRQMDGIAAELLSAVAC